MTTLEDIIKAEITSGGPITFARFMELALYHPEMGYYGSGRVRIGKAGDFYTSSHASPLFGRLMVEIYLRTKAALGGSPCAFIEMGAGEGHMARDFMDGLKSGYPGGYKDCGYVIVERSAAMTRRQKETLGEHTPRVKWHASIDDLPEGVTGLFFSNELVDSFPFHRLHQTEDSLKEIYVTAVDGQLADTPGALSSPEIARHFNRIGLRLPAGMTTEVNLEAARWMRSVARKLGRGLVLTVDYGYPAYEYYSPERSSGTIMCYHRHTVGEDPYRLIGEQDITAHVEFSTLALVGREEGLLPAVFTDQTSFLMQAVADLDASMKRGGATQEEHEKVGRGLKALMHPDWLGGAFKALVQTKDVDADSLFAGIRNRLDELWKKGDVWSRRIV